MNSSVVDNVPTLVLASASPRRRCLLGDAGYEFAVVAPDIDESVAAGENPLLATLRLALEKAVAVADVSSHPEVVLAADTSVICGERMFGKPSTEEEAVAFLLALGGRSHDVVTAWTALCGYAGPRCLSGYYRTVVRMREITRREAETYAASGEPMDKAGAYAAQGRGRGFIAALLGDYDNVVGLPLLQVRPALAALGIVPR